MPPCLAIVRTSARKVSALPGLSRNIYKCSARGMPSRIPDPLPGQGALQLSLFASVPAGTLPSSCRAGSSARNKELTAVQQTKSPE